MSYVACIAENEMSRKLIWPTLCLKTASVEWGSLGHKPDTKQYVINVSGNDACFQIADSAHLKVHVD